MAAKSFEEGVAAFAAPAIGNVVTVLAATLEYNMADCQRPEATSLLAVINSFAV